MSNNSAEMQNAMNQINNLIKNSISANKVERQQGKYYQQLLQAISKKSYHNYWLVIAIVTLDGMRLDEPTTSTLINYIQAQGGPFPD